MKLKIDQVVKLTTFPFSLLLTYVKLKKRPGSLRSVKLNSELYIYGGIKSSENYIKNKPR